MGFSSLREKALEGQNKSSVLLYCHKIPLPLNILLASPSSSATIPPSKLRLNLEKHIYPSGTIKIPKVSVFQVQDSGDQNNPKALINKLIFPNTTGCV